MEHLLSGMAQGFKPESGAIRDELMRMIAFEGAYFVGGNGATGDFASSRITIIKSWLSGKSQLRNFGAQLGHRLAQANVFTPDSG